ncbi:DUF2071 domain-containing protein [Lentzea sp. BCCO 10_0856]|uniref:DUF2071 domain-containing protein n=1 Tax=Lentzea miocenica TaxID=3095431 RepID=A0ABU4ST09_9PSEU|nr:DUF2071 domain-containing protein [Lentzea sp. BCCO 10_0856]MDX8029024.1 DUF2071 domain-containing protein [Lentzea sp. BCCO 10_0856]
MTEPVTPLTPRPVRIASVGQWWRDVTFLHWAVPPESVAGFLPAGTRPDTLNGLTYIGLVPFRMHPIGGTVGPRLPYVGTFCETNVRLYSVDEAGRRGVVFLSLDASRVVPVMGARISSRLPYKWSSMRLKRDGDVITYTCRRLWPAPRGASSRVVVRVGPAVEPDELSRFLTARWGLHVSWYGRTIYLPNDHPEWRLHSAELLELDDELVAAAGLEVPVGPPVSVLHSPGVPVRFGVPSK